MELVTRVALNHKIVGSKPTTSAKDEDEKKTGSTPVPSRRGRCAGCPAGMPSSSQLRNRSDKT